MKGVKQDCINVMEDNCAPVDVIRDIVKSGTQEDSFYVMDLGEVVARYNRWKKLMPRVEPFYAVKCNNHKLLVSTMAALGAGFDCASKGEIELVTSLGVESNRIIFANPAKMVSHIRYSSAVGVDYMTFDSQEELDKIKQHMPHAQLVLRFRCDAKTSLCCLGEKFGCDPLTEALDLLKHAAVIQLNVVGVSFHVGSGAMETEVFARGIALCRKLFDMGASVGLASMHLVDIGGGFSGVSSTNIYEVSQVVNSALLKHFPEDNVRVVAEPGRYFATAPYTLATCVHSKRKINGKESGVGGETQTMYFINDGIYGSFQDVVHLQEEVIAELLYPTSEPSLPCSVWGPTLDSLDCVIANTRLPPLQIGDWLIFRNMGAYTLAVASTFNGFPVPKVWPFVDSKHWSMLKVLHPLTSMQLSKKRDSDVKNKTIAAITAYDTDFE